MIAAQLVTGAIKIRPPEAKPHSLGEAMPRTDKGAMAPYASGTPSSIDLQKIRSGRPLEAEQVVLELWIAVEVGKDKARELAEPVFHH